METARPSLSLPAPVSPRSWSEAGPGSLEDRETGRKAKRGDSHCHMGPAAPEGREGRGRSVSPAPCPALLDDGHLCSHSARGKWRPVSGHTVSTTLLPQVSVLVAIVHPAAEWVGGSGRAWAPFSLW
jgi:hypothetical protein